MSQHNEANSTYLLNQYVASGMNIHDFSSYYGI